MRWSITPLRGVEVTRTAAEIRLGAEPYARKITGIQKLPEATLGPFEQAPPPSHTTDR